MIILWNFIVNKIIALIIQMNLMAWPDWEGMSSYATTPDKFSKIAKQDEVFYAPSLLWR